MGGRRGQEERGGGGAGRLFSLTAFLPGSLETAQRPGEVSTGPRPSQRQPKRNGEPDLIDPDGLALDDLRETDALHLREEERDRRLRKGKPLGASGRREGALLNTETIAPALLLDASIRGYTQTLLSFRVFAASSHIDLSTLFVWLQGGQTGFLVCYQCPREQDLRVCKRSPPCKQVISIA